MRERQEQVRIGEFTPWAEQPKQEEVKPDEVPPEEAPVEAPPVAPVVAAAPSPQITFAVPVPGAVVTPQARFATPPPPVGAKVASAPVKFDPNANRSAGTFPDPDYPGYALRQRYQGVADVEITVDPSGRVINAVVAKTSGFTLLDEAAVKAVKER